MYIVIIFNVSLLFIKCHICTGCKQVYVAISTFNQSSQRIERIASNTRILDHSLQPSGDIFFESRSEQIFM